MSGTRRVDLVDERRERRALAATRCARDEDETALFRRDLFEDFRQQQVLDRGHAHRDDAEDHPDRAALLERITAEAAEARDAVREVDLVVVSKLVAVPGGEHGRRHGDDILVLEPALFGCGNQGPADPHHGVSPDLDVEVRGAPLNGNLE